MTLEYWYMLPVATGVATVAMASGVEGATFFAPIFLLGLGLPAEVAIGTGLITEVFGFASGVTSYVRRGLVDYRLARALLVATVPAAVLGSLVVGFFRPDILEAILGMGLVAVALAFLRAPDHEEVERLDRSVDEDHGAQGETCILTADGEEVRYTVCNRLEGRAIAGVGALFMGMTSTGLGELNGYFLLRRCRVPSRIAVGTGVLVVAVTALSAASVHLYHFVKAGGDTLPTVLSLTAFTVPGVLIGGQLGPALAARVPGHVLEKVLGVLFFLIGVLMLGKVAL
ncbi:MAG: sulfite exporter TauE/SafE family protein [Longimicrobiales bacterium]|nr:sulfite exporter TauE/SafE family protein [Longimicrobiales bacterium]